MVGLPVSAPQSGRSLSDICKQGGSAPGARSFLTEHRALGFGNHVHVSRRSTASRRNLCCRPAATFSRAGRGTEYFRLCSRERGRLGVRLWQRRRADHHSFSDQFGPLPNPNLTIAPIPDGTLPGYSAPGVLLLSQRQWGQAVNTRQLANLVAGQWWGNQVMAASPSDVWLTDGLSRYSEALYVEQSAGRDGMNKALNDFAIGALMYDSTSPIGEAGRLSLFAQLHFRGREQRRHGLSHAPGAAWRFRLLRSLARLLQTYSGKAASLADFEKLAEDHVVQAPAKPELCIRQYSAVLQRPRSRRRSNRSAQYSGLLRPVDQFHRNPRIQHYLYRLRTKTGFRIDGKIKQNLDFFRMPVELQVLTEGNPEIKTVEVSGTDSSFSTEVFGRPKPGDITLDPHNYILKSSQQLRVRAIIARGETFAEQGRYYDAIQQYQQALDQQKNNALAEFRMAEAFFYQKNYSAAANGFRDALDGDIDPSFKWVEVWGHIYLGKVYDIAGDRARAVNEYSKAQQTNDNTGGAQDEAKKYAQALQGRRVTTSPPGILNS